MHLGVLCSQHISTLHLIYFSNNYVPKATWWIILHHQQIELCKAIRFVRFLKFSVKSKI